MLKTVNAAHSYQPACLMGRGIALLGFLLICLYQPVAGQYYTGYDEWEYQLSLYTWATEQEGSITVAGEEIPIDATFGDFLEVFSRALNLRLMAKKGNFSFLFEGRFVDLRDRDLSVDIILLELSGGYRVIGEWLEVIGGGRYFKISAEGKTAEGEEANGDLDWFDPFVGTRVTVPLTRSLRLIASGDIGGFGVGSEFAWNVAGVIDWRLSNFSVAAGYRIWDVRYETGSGADFYKYDVQTRGPGIGITFYF